MCRLRLSPAALEAIARCSAWVLQHSILISFYASAAIVGALLVTAFSIGDVP